MPDPGALSGESIHNLALLSCYIKHHKNELKLKKMVHWVKILVKKRTFGVLQLLKTKCFIEARWQETWSDFVEEDHTSPLSGRFHD